MKPKFTLLLAAVAVVALAVPAIANASPDLTSGGSLVSVGTKVTLTSTNLVTTTSLGKITCEKTTINGEVTENTGTKVGAKGTEAGTSAGCLLNGKAVTFTDITWNNLSMTAAGKGTINLTYVSDITPTLTCHFTSASAPFTYTAGTDIMVFNAADFVATPAACEPGLLSGNVTLAAFGGGGIILG